MTKEEARRAVRASWRPILQRMAALAKEKVNGEASYICPLCGHGAHGDGLTFDPTSPDGNSLHCFGCSFHGDIIDLYQAVNGVEYGEALSLLAAEIGVHIDGGTGRPTPAPAAQRAQAVQRPEADHCPGWAGPAQYGGSQRPTPAGKEVDYTAFFKEAARHLQDTDYHRGIGLATLQRFGVGYVAAWRHPKAPQAVPTSPRLIIPTSKSSYLARDTRRPMPQGAEQYAKSKVGKVHIFNLDALSAADQPVFVVEGELDALSIIDAGGQALALGSTANWHKLADFAANHPQLQPLILSLDNDEPGRKAENSLAAALQGAGISFYRQNIAAPYKDANEALQVDRMAFVAAVSAATEAALAEAQAQTDAQREELEHEAAAYSLQNFLDDIAASASATYIPTGFEGLDSILDGGLFPGLYVVGAISSLGKTTFCLQMADQIAAAGHDVLIFSLEMARSELIAKSISRLTVLQDLQQNGSTSNAKTTRGILTGSRYASYSRAEKEMIKKAASLYGEAARCIYITEGVGDVGVKEIRERVQRHVRITGRRPVVVIDYLQIIAPADIRATDKQNTDKAVLELKRLSRDLDIPVVGISSFNRDNYTQPVNLSSFKESGAIEYSSDVLIGLQYTGMDYQEGETDKNREKRIRELLKQAAADAKTGKAQHIHLKILKNRNGSKGEMLLEFYPMFNYFREDTATLAGQTPSRAAKRL